MEILDPDLWNDDGTPKRPSKDYMNRLGENPVFQQFAASVAKIAEDTTSIEVSDKPVVQAANESYLNYARIKRETKAARPPEVGDIVHLWDHEQAVCRAAVVTQTEALNHDSELHVFVPRKPAEFWFAVHDESKGDESWHWPCGEGQ